LVNEAALLASRKGASAVRTEDFTEALEKITLGPARSTLLNPADRERTAYHEAGHALLALLVPGSDPVHRVSIVPRGMTLGATYQLPVDDRISYAEDYLRARITSTLGGRAAEQLVYGVVTSGAEHDLQHVTEIARHMVVRWGMRSSVRSASSRPGTTACRRPSSTSRTARRPRSGSMPRSAASSRSVTGTRTDCWRSTATPWKALPRPS
jgi:cell division protease FtsH